MSDKSKKILVIQQKMIGDVLTSTILLEALRKNFPDAELHYLVNSHTIPVVENNPFVDKLMPFTPEMEQNKWVFFQFLKAVRKEKYEVVIDVYGKISSSLITRYSGAKKRISYHKIHSSFLYTDTIKRLQNPIHNAGLAIENRLKLLEPLELNFEYFSPKIFLTPEENEAGRSFLEQAGLDTEKPIFMLAVLGSSQQKTYPLEYMAKLIDEIVEKEPTAQLLFNYIPSQKEEARKVFELCGEEAQRKIHFEIYANSLRQFIYLTFHCDALIGNEGGAVNMAKALGVPTFMIFCPFIKKQNWFGKQESTVHQAVHLADFIDMNEADLKAAKKDPAVYYSKLKPEMIFPKLKTFLERLD